MLVGPQLDILDINIPPGAAAKRSDVRCNFEESIFIAIFTKILSCDGLSPLETSI